jgi:hypothetical protein
LHLSTWRRHGEWIYMEGLILFFEVVMIMERGEEKEEPSN